MIFDRWYKPGPDELIYHYCRPEPFVEIIRNRSIWLSASYTMNDTSERSWGYSVFKKAAKILERDTGPEFIRKIMAPVIAGDNFAMLMLGCFSLDADVLSQWRAYGDDGRGFAIGFSAKLMDKVPVRQLSVLYDEDAQIKELTGNLNHIYQIEKSNGFKYDEKFQIHVFQLGLDLCAYKNPAYREEREIRLAHLSGLDRTTMTAIPLGAIGPDGKRKSDPLQIHFRVAKGVVTPYVVADYSIGGTVSPIKEIVLGPRNENAEINIQLFLNTLESTDVKVRRSNVPYR